MLDVLQLISKFLDNDVDKDRANTLMSIKHDTSSITKRASEAISFYPMIVSTSVDDYDKVSDLAKWLEVRYAAFTLVAAGLDPIMGGKGEYNVRKTLGKYQTNESDAPLKDTVLSCKISGMSESMQEYFDKSMKFYSKFGGMNVSSPAIDKVKKFIGESTKPNRPTYAPDLVKEDDWEKMSTDEKEKYLKEKGLDSQKLNLDREKTDPKRTEMNLAAKIDGDLKLKDPTFITLKFVESETQKDITVTIGVKVVPHYLANEEFAIIMGRNVKDGIFTRFIRWRSGEIKFWQDFVLNLDNIKKDKDLYQSLQRHPWFKKLEEAKTANVLQKVLRFFKATKEFSSKDLFLPACTLVCADHELIKAGIKEFKYMEKNPKISQYIDSMYLLGMTIFSADKDLYTTFFSGIAHPFNEKALKLKDTARKTDETLAEAMVLLSRKF